MINNIAKAFQNKTIPLPVPAFALKIALGEMSIEVTKSTTISANKWVGEGYQFKFPTLKSALESMASTSDE